jgi:hypothetical protein
MATQVTTVATDFKRTTEPYRLRVGITRDNVYDVKKDAERAAALHADFESMGVDPQGEFMAAPKPELNGRLYKVRRDDPRIFLIDRGQRRFVPDPATFNNLFLQSQWETEINANLFDITPGDSIESGAVLVRGDGTAQVYLVDRGEKRLITSPAVMDKYSFDWNRVYVVPPILVRSIRSADPIS